MSSVARRGAIAAGVVGTAAVMIASAAPAMAAGGLNATYKVTGSTYIKANDSTVTLGPATLTVKLKAGGTLTGSLPLPPTTDSFTMAGLVPVTSTVTFIPVGKVTGKVVTHKKRKFTRVSSTAQDTLQLSDVTVGGVPVDVGTSCETIDPVSLTVKSAPKTDFNVIDGGDLSGKYTIGDFQNCGLLTDTINSSVAGGGNTITLHLGKAHIQN